MTGFLKRTEEFMLKHKKGLFITLILMAFVMTALMFMFEEYYADDLFYMRKWDSDELLGSFADIVYFQKMHYNLWGGRTPGYTVLQFLLCMGRPAAGIAGACGFFLLVKVICRAGLTQKITMPYFALTMGMLYFLNSNFYETIEWYTGAGIYMFPMMFVMSAMIPFFAWVKNGEFTAKWYHWLLLPVVLCAGWSLENIAPTMLVIMGLILWMRYRKEKKLDLYMTICMILAFAGCLLLLIAPGNYARGEEFSGGLMAIAYRGHGQINAWFNWLFLPLLTAVLAAVAVHAEDPEYLKNDRCTQLLAVWFVLSNLIMIASPTYPERTTIGPLVILLPLILRLLEKYVSGNEKREKILALIAFWTGISFVFALLSIDLLAIVRSAGVYIPH